MGRFGVRGRIVANSITTPKQLATIERAKRTPVRIVEIERTRRGTAYKEYAQAL